MLHFIILYSTFNRRGRVSVAVNRKSKLKNVRTPIDFIKHNSRPTAQEYFLTGWRDIANNNVSWLMGENSARECV